MISLTLPVSLKPGQLFIFCPIGDIHWDSAECDQPRFRRLIQWFWDQQAGGAIVRILGTGDNQDMHSPSERSSLLASKLHETSMKRRDKENVISVGEFAEVLRPVAENIIGLISGHHFFKFFSPVDGCVNSDQLLAKRLKTRYFGDGTVKLTFTFPYGLVYRLALAHGWGSARTEGAKVAKRIAYGTRVAPESDCVYLAHDNMKMAISCRDSSKRKRLYCGVGGFQESYLEGDLEAGYVEKAGMPPADLGIVPLFLKVEKRDGVWRVDAHASV